MSNPMLTSNRMFIRLW